MCSTAAADPLVSLEAALNALAGEDLPVDDAGRLDRVRRLAAAQNRIAAQLARTVRRAEVRQAAEHDGLKTMASWLRSHTRLSGAAVTQLKRQGRALESLPAVADAFAAGSLTADAVDVLAQLAKPEHLDRAAGQGVDLAAVESACLAVAASRPYRDVQVAVGTYLARLDPDGTEPDPTEGRLLSYARHRDGTPTLGGTLDGVGGEKVATAVEAIAAASRCAGDDRTRAQRLGDALVQLADLALASGELPVLRTVKPHVVLTVPVADLADPAVGHGAARTGLGEVLSAAKARWLACDATITRIVLDPDGLPLDVSRSQRIFPAHIRKAVVAALFALRRVPPRAKRVAGGAGCFPDQGWRDLAGQRRAALRTPPHQGPPRLPRRTRRRRATGRPMAHVPPRRHRDPHRTTAGCGMSADGLAGPGCGRRPRRAPSGTWPLP